MYSSYLSAPVFTRYETYFLSLTIKSLWQLCQVETIFFFSIMIIFNLFSKGFGDVVLINRTYGMELFYVLGR